MISIVVLVLAAASCPPGQSVGPETAGQCCWGGQVWSKMQKRCVGAPACPQGLRAEGDACVVDCPAGQSVSADTDGRCCWPNQVWANSRGVCVGVPACPGGFMASGETCVPAAATPPPASVPPPPVAQPAPGPTPPPPVAAPPPPVRPVDVPSPPPSLQPQNTNVSLIRQELADLRGKLASTTYLGAIIGVVVGPPTIAIGVFVTASEPVWGPVLAVLGAALVIAGIVDFPVTAVRRGHLTREIRQKEQELAAAERLGLLPRVPPELAAAFTMMSPVLTF